LSLFYFLDPVFFLFYTLATQKQILITLTFTTPFFGAEKAERAARQLQVPLTIQDITDPHWVMLKNPQYGYGKRMNPCIDCQALRKMISLKKGFFRKMAGLGCCIFPDPW
jgi:hypothetical protein